MKGFTHQARFCGLNFLNRNICAMSAKLFLKPTGDIKHQGCDGSIFPKYDFHLEMCLKVNIGPTLYTHTDILMPMIFD